MLLKALILFAHPRLERSKIHAGLLRYLPNHPNIYLHDLYEEYPDFNIDIKREQALAEAHDIIVWQHPMYWYSVPPLLKQWLDMTLEPGWAYGPEGRALAGKKLLHVVSTGGSAEAYAKGGRNRFTIREFLAPLEQTAHLCGMDYLPPYIIFGSHHLDEESLHSYGSNLAWLLNLLISGAADREGMKRFEYMNDWITQKKV
ncbi:MAG: NAD(P)H-dependent oxidoreductase [Chitinophagales bacterium]|nr:NAD(P)H-dependent oxidoreductase [Chitinophagales bacterium]MDW8274437.1 NAD(P)H-dependent oxidoreductase [Chitinophagales bacterium]